MNRDPHEQALLEHYRRHSDEQPSAQVDARILAAARAARAARAAVQPQAEKNGWAERLRHWLLGAGSPQRWGVAVAGLATLGIGLSLTLRTFDEAPERFDAPAAPAMMRSAPAPAPAAAMAPAFAPAADPAPEYAEAKRKAEVTARNLASKQAAAPAVEAPGRLAEEAEQPEALADAQAVQEPQASLLRLRTLQAQGKVEEARALRQNMQQQYPKLDIDAALKALPVKP